MKVSLKLIHNFQSQLPDKPLILYSFETFSHTIILSEVRWSIFKFFGVKLKEWFSCTCVTIASFTVLFHFQQAPSHVEVTTSLIDDVKSEQLHRVRIIHQLRHKMIFKLEMLQIIVKRTGHWGTQRQKSQETCTLLSSC